jgi:hypothetical protein
MAGWRTLGLAVVVVSLADGRSVLAQKPRTEAGIPVDPQAITFGVSPDHDAPADSRRHVIKYVVDFIPLVGMGRARELDLGRPPVSNGVITVPLASAGLKAGRYIASVRAVNAMGSSTGATVGPFQIGKPRRTSAAPSSPPPTNAPAAEPTSEPQPQQDQSKPGFWRRVYGKIVG